MRLTRAPRSGYKLGRVRLVAHTPNGCVLRDVAALRAISGLIPPSINRLEMSVVPLREAHKVRGARGRRGTRAHTPQRSRVRVRVRRQWVMKRLMEAHDPPLPLDSDASLTLTLTYTDAREKEEAEELLGDQVRGRHMSGKRKRYFQKRKFPGHKELVKMALVLAAKPGAAASGAEEAKEGEEAPHRWPLTWTAQLPHAVKPACEAVVSREPVYVAGRYCKYQRGLPQTLWLVGGERIGESSVEEFVSGTFLPLFKVARATHTPHTAHVSPSPSPPLPLPVQGVQVPLRGQGGRGRSHAGPRPPVHSAAHWCACVPPTRLAATRARALTPARSGGPQTRWRTWWTTRC